MLQSRFECVLSRSCCLEGYEDEVNEEGMAVQVHPMNPKLVPPGTDRLKLKFINCFQLLLSNSTCAATGRGTGGRGWGDG
jgi:hypothetical protein